MNNLYTNELQTYDYIRSFQVVVFLILISPLEHPLYFQPTPGDNLKRDFDYFYRS